jgi:hypothetical protein
MNRASDDWLGSDDESIMHWLGERGLAAITEEELARLRWIQWEYRALVDALWAHGIHLTRTSKGWTSTLGPPGPLPRPLVEPEPYRWLLSTVYEAIQEYTLRVRSDDWSSSL